MHECPECGYKTNRDVAAQVVVQRGLAAVGHTVKLLSEGKVIRLPGKKIPVPLGLGSVKLSITAPSVKLFSIP
jgi:hypothetical protein